MTYRISSSDNNIILDGDVTVTGTSNLSNISVSSFTITGNATIGTDSTNTLTVNSTSTFVGNVNITRGTITGITDLAIADGGTGASTKTVGFNNLSPIAVRGDLIIGNGTNSATRLPIGSNGFVLTSTGTTATWQALGGGTVYGGVYTPSLTGITNTVSTTAYECQFSRVSNVVTVSGALNVNVAASSADTVVGIALPVASNLTIDSQCCGTGSCATPGFYNVGAAVIGNITTDTANMLFIPNATGDKKYVFNFTYKIN